MSIKTVYLTAWTQFTRRLRSELKSVGHTSPVLCRNFETVTVDLDEEYIQTGSTDRYKLLLSTGTDRDRNSTFWNVENFDHDHTSNPAEKSADEIIYAYLVDHTEKPMQIILDGRRKVFSLTSGLNAYSAITIYDAAQLDRVTRNEYWFKGSPLDAAMLVFLIEGQDDEA